MSDSKLKWQCRRGMKELDILLEHWLEAQYESASDADKQAFQRLLALPDPELARYLLAGDPIDTPELARVIGSIRGRTRD